MLQPAEPRKYQLFPTKERMSSSPDQKSPEADGNLSLGQTRIFDKDRSKLPPSLRLKNKDQPLVRRRKISITDIGAMTTVQEVPMDSREFDLNIIYIYSIYLYRS
jgi:hypothetical protein